ncbi:MAG: hypothetical protein NT070_11375 [Cyanobacteria bacterium]|nr:hypothetical protein [Cyanobacteriota bacterium]
MNDRSLCDYGFGSKSVRRNLTFGLFYNIVSDYHMTKSPDRALTGFTIGGFCMEADKALH